MQSQSGHVCKSLLAEVGIADNEPVALPHSGHQGTVHPLKLSASAVGGQAL